MIKEYSNQVKIKDIQCILGEIKTQVEWMKEIKTLLNERYSYLRRIEEIEKHLGEITTLTIGIGENEIHFKEDLVESIKLFLAELILFLHNEGMIVEGDFSELSVLTKRGIKALLSDHFGPMANFNDNDLSLYGKDKK